MATNVHLHCLLGLQTRDFAMIAADQINTQSIIVMKNNENKIHHISEKLMMGLVGDAGDASQFAQFIVKNMQLYHMRNKYRLDTAAAVHFTRKNLADLVRTGTPAVLNMLVAGYDDELGGQLYAMDMLASCVKVPYAVHGFGGHLSMGILDRYHNYMLTEAQAYEVMKLCVHEVHQRLFISLPNFQVKLVSRTGIKELPVINCHSFTTHK